MDYTAEELEDLATMRGLRLRLRACADTKIAECEAMGLAKNWLDMNRQIKAIMAADTMVVRLYSPPPRRRTAKRPRQDKPVDLPPPYAKHGEVSAGAPRRMTEYPSWSRSF
ncbi:MAG: hypothetical protein WDN06_20530 [Asticcacaulis sp.]